MLRFDDTATFEPFPRPASACFGKCDCDLCRHVRGFQERNCRAGALAGRIPWWRSSPCYCGTCGRPSRDPQQTPLASRIATRFPSRSTFGTRSRLPGAIGRIEIVRPETASPYAELGAIRRFGTRPERQIRFLLPLSSALTSRPGHEALAKRPSKRSIPLRLYQSRRIATNKARMRSSSPATSACRRIRRTVPGCFSVPPPCSARGGPTGSRPGSGAPPGSDGLAGSRPFPAFRGRAVVQSRLPPCSSLLVVGGRLLAESETVQV